MKSWVRFIVWPVIASLILVGAGCGGFSKQEQEAFNRVTITICLTYLNFTLAIYLAGKFFNDPKIVVPVVLSVLPWSLLIIPFKYGMKKLK